MFITASNERCHLTILELKHMQWRESYLPSWIRVNSQPREDLNEPHCHVAFACTVHLRIRRQHEIRLHNRLGKWRNCLYIRHIDLSHSIRSFRIHWVPVQLCVYCDSTAFFPEMLVLPDLVSISYSCWDELTHRESLSSGVFLIIECRQ